MIRVSYVVIEQKMGKPLRAVKGKFVCLLPYLSYVCPGVPGSQLDDAFDKTCTSLVGELKQFRQASTPFATTECNEARL
jgi:hypothetical protein